jgi:hypothetical protein
MPHAELHHQTFLCHISSPFIDPAAIKLNVRPELVEGRPGFDKLSPNGGFKFTEGESIA